MDLKDYPSLKDWYMRIASRTAVQRGYAIPLDLPVPLPEVEEQVVRDKLSPRKRKRLQSAAKFKRNQ